MKKKIALIMAIVFITTVGLTGCKKKEEGPTKEDLMDEIEVLQDQVEQLTSENTDMSSILSEIRGEADRGFAITSVQDGTKNETFNSIEGKIIFPGKLKYTGASQAPNTSGVMLTSRIKFNPSNNWVIQINGTTTKLYHPNGVWGTIKVSYVPELVKIGELIDNELIPFVEQIPNTFLSYGKVYLEDIWKGAYADMSILNENKPAIVRTGLWGHTDTAVSFVFYYNGDRDLTKDELITTLLKSVNVNGLPVRVE